MSDRAHLKKLSEQSQSIFDVADGAAALTALVAQIIADATAGELADAVATLAAKPKYDAALRAFWLIP